MERDHYEYQDVGGLIILKWIFGEIGWGGMDRLHMVHDRDQWRALVNTVLKIRVS
jgi:hypothetical protein